MKRSTLAAMLKWARKRLLQRQRPPLAKHAKHANNTMRRSEGKKAEPCS